MGKVITKGHKKHVDLIRPAIGSFHRNEWAILGTDCTYIRSLAEKVMAAEPNQKIQYIDADHHDHYEGSIGKSQKFTWQGNYDQAVDKFSKAIQFQEASAVLINGNHYPGKRQIIVIDAKKEASLKKRMDQCTNVDLIILRDETAIFSFVKDQMDINQILIVNAKDEDLVLQEITRLLSAYTPKLKALILAGGESKRMGQDKSQLDYYGKAHEIHLAELCQSLGLESYISKKDATEVDGFPVIVDSYVGLGPAGAIASAFLTDPNAAWLVLACDLPFVDNALIQELINARNHIKYASAVKSTNKDFPEPLISIYEPRAYQRLLSFIAMGYSCPRKFLINSDIEIYETDQIEKLTNVNTTEEFAMVKKQIQE